MKKALLLLLATFLASSFLSFAEDDPEPFILLHHEKCNKKRMPPRFPVYLNCADGEACLVTDMPYGCATVAVTDSEGNTTATMMVTPMENCGWLPLEPGDTITCTFDNGTVLCGSY